MNICCFIGRTTDDIEIRYTDDKLAVAKFTLAINDGYGEKEHTSFLHFTAFGKTAESLQKYVRKGTKIGVDSTARQDSWKDKEGNQRSAVGFVVTHWEFAQSKTEEPANEPPEAPDGFVNIPDGVEEELPFA